MTWQDTTPEQKQDLVRQAIVTNGLSYGQAALLLGTSRVAVAGVVERSKRKPNPIVTTAPHKLAQQRKSASEARKKRKPRNAAKAKPRPKKKHQGFNQVVPLGVSEMPNAGEPIATGAWMALPGSAPIAIADHKEGCRWPIGPELPFLYCNEPLHDESPYCSRHYTLGWRELPVKAKPQKETA